MVELSCSAGLTEISSQPAAGPYTWVKVGAASERVEVEVTLVVVLITTVEAPDVTVRV